MKANEFVKNNLWLLEDNLKELKEIISDAKDYKYFCLNNALGHSYDNHGGGVSISIDDLKCLVESHDLVESKGGLTKCKEILAQDNFTWCSGSKVYKNPLKIAVDDVESCMEGV